MSIIHHHQFVSNLLRDGVSHAMIKILEEQRITDEDLQTIDRDDIEHLFKNEYGFTFRDRKRFWSSIQKFQPKNTHNNVVYIEAEDESPDIYEVNSIESPNYHLREQYIPLPSSSNIPSSVRIYNHSNTDIQNPIFGENSSSNSNDSLRKIAVSLPIYDAFIENSSPKSSANFEFKYPVELPRFSQKVTKAFEANDIETEWKTLIYELVQWILSTKANSLARRECQAIGETLFKKYPCIGKNGYRPWSRLCKCITRSLRKERTRKDSLHT
ncbi:unnamed protein product [Rotaria sordida]|uniref:Uncharacterized protein n=1 Tax=Rotaria sordida TaxID=392033 RepID=A0A813MU81_9BILA|nr:unnamed protein product [Rotaria sordida]CAF0783964.1 unnamed protein product [Rotaria sordida]CAF0815402.1 unnamed protein product [Rotaria sordida]CAF0842790.1 unnamed protein product [Rotaria sordida]CAF0878544.1 unnamed protein product [Rotaria sordida]